MEPADEPASLRGCRDGPGVPTWGPVMSLVASLRQRWCPALPDDAAKKARAARELRGLFLPSLGFGESGWPVYRAEFACPRCQASPRNTGGRNAVQCIGWPESVEVQFGGAPEVAAFALERIPPAVVGPDMDADAVRQVSYVRSILNIVKQMKAPCPTGFWLRGYAQLQCCACADCAAAWSPPPPQALLPVLVRAGY